MKIESHMLNSKLLDMRKDELEYVYHKHTLEGKDPHWDIRIKTSSEELIEFNLWDEVIKTKSSRAFYKLCDDVSWFMHRGKNTMKKVGTIPSHITVLDYGYVKIMKNVPDLTTFDFRSTGIFKEHRLNGYYTYIKKDDDYYFEKGKSLK